MDDRAIATATMNFDKEDELLDEYCATGLLLACLDSEDEARAMEKFVLDLPKGTKVKITIELIN